MARPVTGPDHVLFYFCGFKLLSFAGLRQSQSLCSQLAHGCWPRYHIGADSQCPILKLWFWASLRARQAISGGQPRIKRWRQ